MPKKTLELSFEHIRTGINIKCSNICQTCPYRLYADAHETVTMGAGNIYSNFIFILPTYDVKAKIGYASLLSLLNNSYQDVIGRSIFEDIYITRLVKCNKNTGHSIYDSAIAPCSNYLSYEVRRLAAKNVVFFGSAYDDYNNNSGTVGLYFGDKKVHKIYSPAVLFYDNPIFKERFFNSLNEIINNN